MSWATCYSGSNNIHFNFPPIMADGRNYASWQPDAAVNNSIREKENIKSNWEYRQYLQKNASQIMKFNTSEACYELGLSSHEQTNNVPSSNVPFAFTSVFDTNQPGYGYRTSDLKTPYLSREQLYSRMIAPSIVPK
jgi:hypothetical protein